MAGDFPGQSIDFTEKGIDSPDTKIPESGNIQVLQEEAMLALQIEIVEEIYAEVKEDNEDIVKEKIPGEQRFLYRAKTFIVDNKNKILNAGRMVAVSAVLTSCVANASTIIVSEDSLRKQEGTQAVATETYTPTQEPTVVIEPTATEMAPEVDLGWHDWMIFKDVFGGWSQPVTEELMEEKFNPKNYDGPIYMFFTRDGVMRHPMTVPYETTTPKYNPGWDYVEAINSDKVGLALDLSDVEKEILKQYILFRKDDGKNLRLFLFIEDKKEGEEIRCFREKEGSLVVIEDSTEEEKLNTGKNFKVTIYEDEDIPWYELPRESWEGIKANNTMLDLRNGKINSFCDINDIKGGVDPR